MHPGGRLAKLALLALAPLIASVLVLGHTPDMALADVTQPNGCFGIPGQGFAALPLLITGTGTPNPDTAPNPITLSNQSVQLNVSTTLLAAGAGLGIISSADSLADIGVPGTNPVNPADTKGGVTTTSVGAGAASFKITGTNTFEGTQTTHNAAAISTTFYAVTVAATGVTTFYSAISSPPSPTPDPSRTGTVMAQLTVTVPLASTTWTPVGPGSVVFSEANVVPSNLTAPTAADLAAAPIAVPVGGLLLGPLQFHCWTGSADTATPPALVAAAPSPIDTVTVNPATLTKSLVGLTPARIMDTRNPGASGPVAPGGTVSLPVLGHGGVPATGVSAVVLNVTVTDTLAPGYITVYPDGVSRPTASSLNFVANQTVPNLVIAPVGAGGSVDFYNGSSNTVQLVADVSGYFS
jgi:hypothetical protein